MLQSLNDQLLIMLLAVNETDVFPVEETSRYSVVDWWEKQ
jgi:hypothetical protein